ncbi:MAG: type II toxin-antitoxin system RelE/ParE family toxin [Thioploca sp.]|nr:type II toxin-antitoxin system RelE/ParE family toxin [Thioploca sp.]
MQYQIVFKPKAIKSLEKIPAQDRTSILVGIEKLPDNLLGDVKRLTNFTPEYRLRIGKYRVLFEIEKEIIIIYNILLRKIAYRRK